MYLCMFKNSLRRNTLKNTVLTFNKIVYIFHCRYTSEDLNTTGRLSVFFMNGFYFNKDFLKCVEVIT